MSRQHFSTPIAELERLVRAQADSPGVLGPIYEELAYRQTERALRLRAQVRALLDVTLRAPSVPPEAVLPAEPAAVEGLMLLTRQAPVRTARNASAYLGCLATVHPSVPESNPVPALSLVMDSFTDEARNNGHTRGAAPVSPSSTNVSTFPMSQMRDARFAPPADEAVEEPQTGSTPGPRAGAELAFAAPPAEDATISPAVARARQLFRFLRDFAERNVLIRRTLREQLWTLSLTDLPKHPSIHVGAVMMVARAAAQAPGVDDTEPLVRIRRPQLTQAPRAPQIYDSWVSRHSDDPSVPPLLHHDRQRPWREEERTRDEAADSQPVTERRDADPAREAALQGWLATWEAWAVTERPARQAMHVFERLYALLGRIERESERVELMLGDGRLRRATETGLVDHPVLLQRVELEFDAGALEFRIVDADRAPELYGAVLQGDDGISGERLHQLQQELERAGFHPLGADGTGGFLQRIAGLLGPNARFLTGDDASSRADVPTICREPVLFLRVRSSGLPAAMTRVLEDLGETTDVPKGIKHVVGMDDVEITDGGGGTAAGVASAIADAMTAVGEPPDVLLAKPANLEQVQIARALARHGTVLVQGPPGTGKSHTIANLIGHLVAQGDRVLVTSHTTKALRVLRQHVPEDLRPLCVALLDQDLEGRTQLEEAVRGIVERVGASDERTLEREVARLTDTRQRLMETTAALHEQLRVARVAEYEPVVIAGEAIEPVDAARLALDEHERHAWLPGPVTPGAPLPLSLEELEQLYATNTVLTREEERELEVTLPPRARVLGALPFGDLVAALDVIEPGRMARFWESPSAERDESLLMALTEAVERLVRDLSTMAPWQRALVAAGRQGEPERDLWRKLRSQVDEVVAGHVRTRDLLLDYMVERIPGASDDELGAVGELRQHVASGGAIGRLALTFKPRWRAVINAWRVNGEVPSRAEHFAAIAAWSELETRRRTLRLRWERQAVPVGLPPLGALPEPPETALGEYAAQFDGLTGWWDARWSELASHMAATGFRWAAFREAEVARATPLTPFESDVAIASGSLLEVVNARLGAARRLRAERLLAEQATLLRGHTGEIAGALHEAVTACDVAGWAAARAALDAVGAKADTWGVRTALLTRLGRDAPAWADAVRVRDGVHGNTRAPEGATRAWRWRQVVQELERRASVDEREVARDLERRRTELRDVTCELIDRKAWLAQLRRTDGDARRALIGWSDTQKKIGKRTGKRVPELQAEARKLLSQARDAVPVWIMPLARVAENFDPRGRKFDVVIVDEASQSDVTGLLAFYLGKRVAVVGDHEQVSPSAVGQKLDGVEHLIAQHLIGIPNAHLYDGQTSIYDLARQAFGGNLALREHFRCVPDIIEFSNHLAYNGQMRPLRDPSTAPDPHVAEYVVAAMVSGGSDGKVNLAEARATAALLAAMAEMPEYAGKSFGAISLVGDEQALQVQTLLLSLLDAVGLQERRFAAGNPAQFQGDERDVVVLSMVDRPSLTGRPLPLRDTAMFKQRYNVAVSRARDQLWLVHSLEPGRDLQPHDLRHRLIDHVRDPGAVRRAQAAATRRAESPFEAAVMERLVSAGFRITPQVDVGRYRIDMMVSDGERRVAMECDGDRFHPPEQIPEDIARQAVLERAGWRFVRLRGTRFYRDPEGSMRWVFDELARLGVSPVGQAPAPEATSRGEMLRNAVVRRAWSIMQERGWVAVAVADRAMDVVGDDSASDAAVIC